MRFEIPITRWSWVTDGQPVVRVVGAHCIDTDWPWVPEWRDRRTPRRRRPPVRKRKTTAKRKKR